MTGGGPWCVGGRRGGEASSAKVVVAGGRARSRVGRGVGELGRVGMCQRRVDGGRDRDGSGSGGGERWRQGGRWGRRTAMMSLLSLKDDY